MNQKPNYQLEMEKQLGRICRDGARPRLLLHSCCGPCSSYVIEYLRNYFDLTLFYYNPNIWPDDEYIHRREEQKRLISEMASEVEFAEGEYSPEIYYETVKGYESEPEGGARCEKCFALRLDRAAQEAKARGIDWFTTTLTVSPHKDAHIINPLGAEIAARWGVNWLCSDFKKRNGFGRTLELSKEYSLYRQDYCGCVFSAGERNAHTP